MDMLTLIIKKMKILDFNNIKNLKFNSKINFINSSISYKDSLKPK